MKNKLALFTLLTLLPLTSCSNNPFIIKGEVFCFGYVPVEIKLYEGKSEDISEILKVVTHYDEISDNYNLYNKNVCYLNTTNEDVQISKDLYDLLEASFSVNQAEAAYFNPLCGSLSKKWKEALGQKRVLTNEEIESELEKIKTSSLIFKENNVVQRIGEAEIDLGGIAKGYALDKVKDYLDSKNYSKYLIDAASSSILLGEKDSGDGYFDVGIKDLNNAYMKLKNCYVSSSGNSEQGVKIGDITYSHIVNPITGSVINENDTVIVVSNSGYLGDALSTSLTMNTVEEIKAIEEKIDIKTIVIKNGSVVYCNKGLEILYH